ncbi:hypothetical protein [Amycolatopsis sp. NBC_01480]|uniref:hypothetical protein n=1 Tax=Amycolatopsis sp. NBC_01480 TaxID=2903562 RepID=UPI002E2C3B5E|nr:hypothetical protein [Amycolatopsis sp. NBC_01480]
MTGSGCSRMSDPWLRIEVLDGPVPARDWRSAHAEALVTAAIADRAVRWHWRESGRGVVLEVAFRTEQIRDEFRDQLAVKAALDAVPDPRHGLNVVPGGGD